MAPGYNLNLPFTILRIQTASTYNNWNLAATGEKNSALQLCYVSLNMKAAADDLTPQTIQENHCSALVEKNSVI